MRKITYIIQAIDVSVIIVCVTYVPYRRIMAGDSLGIKLLLILVSLLIAGAAFAHFKAVESVRE